MGMQLPEPPPKTTPSTTPPPVILRIFGVPNLHLLALNNSGTPRPSASWPLTVWSRASGVHHLKPVTVGREHVYIWYIYIYRKAATNLLRKQTSWIRMYETLSIVGYNGMANYSTHQLKDFHSSPSNKSSAVHFWHPLKNRSILSFSVHLFSWTIMKSCTFCKSCILKQQKIKTSNWWYHIHYIHIHVYIDTSVSSSTLIRNLRKWRPGFWKPALRADNTLRSKRSRTLRFPGRLWESFSMMVMLPFKDAAVANYSAVGSGIPVAIKPQ